MTKSAKKWCEKGIDLMKKEKFSEAIDCFKKVIKIDSSFEKVWLHMGYCYAGQYYCEKAAESYRKAIEVDPNDYEAIYNLGNYYLESKSDPFIYDEYDEEYEEGDFDEAIKYFEKAIEIQPDFSFAWNNMGFCYGKLGNHAKALESHSKAVELDPNNVSAWVNLGGAHFFLRNYLKALESYEKAIEVDPGHNMAWICLRTTLESYKNKFKLNNENKAMWVRLGRVYLTLDNITEGIECFKHVIELDPKYFEAWHQLGRAYHLMDDHERFMEIFESPSNMDIKKITIITTSDGPLLPDVFWLISSDSGISIVPSEDCGENFLYEVKDLPGFNNDMFIKAMASTDENIFQIWDKNT